MIDYVLRWRPADTIHSYHIVTELDPLFLHNLHSLLVSNGSRQSVLSEINDSLQTSAKLYFSPSWQLHPRTNPSTQSQLSGPADPTFTLPVSPNILGWTRLRRRELQNVKK